jgi:hypothetical protein
MLGSIFPAFLKGGCMRGKIEVGELPYERIPDGLLNPVKQMARKLSPGKLLNRIKKKRQKEEAENKEEQK